MDDTSAFFLASALRVALQDKALESLTVRNTELTAAGMVLLAPVLAKSLHLDFSGLFSVTFSVPLRDH
jgi:hypothetical protein